MMRISRGLLLILVASFLLSTSATVAPAPERPSWPHPVPCRVQDGPDRDLFVITLGAADTPLASGLYDPLTDEVRLNDGTVLKDYFRVRLGIKYIKPIEKSLFPVPPSGWCSWYYYYKDVNEDEVLSNARWIGANLKDYGARYVQIDDGWQGYGKGGPRDWTTLSENFKNGMGRLADGIKSFGLTPGIWIAPHGQSSQSVVRNAKDIFLLKSDGTSASKTWEGDYLVDPSNPRTDPYLKDLFTTLVGWGYDYFKIDGQPVVVNEYRTKGAFMKKNGGDPEILYRRTLESIRSAIGPDRYLLGCWGIPLEGAGIMNGSRTGGDVVLGWEGFLGAFRATMEFYYQHNIVWYTDPDVMLLRPPLSLEQARAWATLQGLTGQALFASDRLPDLPENRVEILKRVFPAVDARPLDLFPSPKSKRVWDLKIRHLGRAYDVVGLFNLDPSATETILLRWADLGLPDQPPVHVFDFWNAEYLGAWETGMAVDVPPAACRVLTLLPSSDEIQLLSTSRHITQGWVDLAAFRSEDGGRHFKGRSHLIKDDPYELRFAFPRGRNFTVKSATAKDVSGGLPVEIFNHQGWSVVRVCPPRTGDADWEVSFEPAGSYKFAVREPAGIRVERRGLDGVDLAWNPQYYLNAGYAVFVNGILAGYAPQASFPLRGLDPSASATVEVRTVWDDGSVSPKAARATFAPADLVPGEIPISELEPARTTSDTRGLPPEWILSRRSLVVSGRRFDAGLGLRSGSEVEYDLKGLFATFSADVGVDDSSPEMKDPEALEFSVVGDGKVLWASGPVRKSDGLKRVEVPVSGVHALVLKVAGGGTSRGWRRPQGDWLNGRLMR
jgi:hypothetical protein